MKTEYEFRIIDVSPYEACKKLKSLGATYVGRWKQKRLIYDSIPKKDHEIIRLRTNGEKTTLAYKIFESMDISGTKEIEVNVSSFEKTNEILEHMGHKARSSQENNRIRFIYNEAEIDVDTWPLIGTYVEVEGKDEKHVLEVIESLGFDDKEKTGDAAFELYQRIGMGENDISVLAFTEEEKKYYEKQEEMMINDKII